MGGGFDETGSLILCDGDDVLVELNDAFGDPTSARFIYAKNHNGFANVLLNDADNYLELIKAYDYAGVPVSPRWARYLKLLGKVVPQGRQNIYDIAQTRNDGLINDVIMQTVVHVPKNGGHVHTRRGSTAGLHSSIDSPCPMPQP